MRTLRVPGLRKCVGCMARNAKKCGPINHSSWLKTPRRWNCIGCHHQFSATAGTPMPRTYLLPGRTRAHAIHLIVPSSTGISTVKLSEMLDISYRPAWHLGHRVHAMMAEANPFLAGVVEINEIYGGALPRKAASPYRDQDHADPPPANRNGSGTKRSLVLVAAERRRRRGRDIWQVGVCDNCERCH